LSPVMALSSTEAAPSITSPSVGTTSPASIRITSPSSSSTASLGWNRSRRRGSARTLARVVTRVARNASARALPRPSAIASAKLAKRTVNQSQIATCTPTTKVGAWTRPSRTARIVTSTDARAVTKITGLRARPSGLSFSTAWPAARPSISPSKRLISAVVDVVLGIERTSEALAGRDRNLLGDGAESEDGQEGQGADDEDGGDEQRHEDRPMRRERAGRRRRRLLEGERAGDGEDGNDVAIAAEQHGDAEPAIVPVDIGIEAGERRAVIAGRRTIGIEQLGEAVRPRVEDRRLGSARDARQR